VRAVLEATDAADQATPAMERAGVDALKAGALDAGGLVNKVWLAMSALRGT
jgi:predicted dinucleotide-binding enzyme